MSFTLDSIDLSAKKLADIAAKLWPELPPVPVPSIYGNAGPRCACGQAILRSRKECDRCAECTRVDAARAGRIAALGRVVTGSQFVHNTQGENQRFVFLRLAPTTNEIVIRLINSRGEMSPETTMSWDSFVWGCIAFDPVPTHEPDAAPRGRTRLKPGVTL